MLSFCIASKKEIFGNVDVNLYENIHKAKEKNKHLFAKSK